jgi:hypothetical protein
MVLAVASSLLASVMGCGGSGVNAALGLDSKADVSLISPNINNFNLIISPREGPANAPIACSDSQTGFGCTRLLDVDSIDLSFRTTEGDSENPYFVYVQNTSSTQRTATLQIRMDSGLQVNETLDVPANTTLHVARIHRNSADEE